MINLDIAAFRAWLEAKEPTKRVGLARECSVCPLAMFTFQQTSMAQQTVRVYDGYAIVVTREGCRTEPLPEWASAFVTFVDTSGEHDITAAAALEILGRVERLGVA